MLFNQFSVFFFFNSPIELKKQSWMLFFKPEVFSLSPQTLLKIQSKYLNLNTELALILLTFQLQLKLLHPQWQLSHGDLQLAQWIISPLQHRWRSNQSRYRACFQGSDPQIHRSSPRLSVSKRSQRQSGCVSRWQWKVWGFGKR